jgi:plastocyanin
MERRGLRASLIILGLIAALVVLPACGGSSGGGGSADKKNCPTTSTVAAQSGKVTVCGQDIKFDVKTITTPAGALEVTFINTGSIAHTFTIKTKDFDLDAGPGKSKTGTVQLEKGSYEFECTVQGHAAAGMKGTIEVS